MMPDNKSLSPLVMDTNMLVKFSIFTPMNIHKAFWYYLDEAVSDRKIILIKEVADECKKGDLNNWINKQRRKGNIVPTSEDVRANADLIDEKYHLIQEIAPGVFKSKTDPVVIAYAQEISGIVFSYESPRSDVNYPMKIPDVCRELGIPCDRLPSRALRDIISPIISHLPKPRQNSNPNSYIDCL